MSIFDDDASIEESTPRCIYCGSTDKKLISKMQFGGCLPGEVLSCKECFDTTKREEDERQYQQSHFCNSCNKKFKRPHFRNVKRFWEGRGFNATLLYLCLDCFNRQPKNVEQPEEQDSWGDDTGSDNSSYW